MPENKGKNDESVSLKDIMARLDTLTVISTTTSNDVKSIKTTIDEMKSDIRTINQRIDSITSEQNKITADVEDLTTRTNEIEEKITTASERCVTLDNNMEQIRKFTELSIVNIPKKLELKQILQDVETWSQTNLSASIKRSFTTNDKTSQSLHLNFWSEQHKNQFMSNVKKKQYNNNGQYIPVLAEDIFEMMESDPGSAELQFRNSMTPMNRQIFNLARKHKKIFKFVWLGDNGHIFEP